MRFTWYWLQKKWMSLLALVVSLASLALGIMSFTFSRGLAHLHMEPTVKCLFDFPNDANPVLLVTNNGDIAVASLSVTHSFYVFNKSTLDLSAAGQSGNLFRDDVLYREELRPADYVSLELVRFDPVDGFIGVYVFDLKFYRQSDMRSFCRREVFYVDEGRVYSRSEFMKTTSYRPIMEQIELLQMPTIQYDPGKLREVLEALED
jgi:hypothetical protein